MPSWKHLLRAVVGIGVLLPAGCGLVAITDGTVEPREPLQSAAVVITPWANGSGFLIDRGERLLVTSAGLLRGDNKAGVEVVFPLLEDGKIKIKRDYYLLQAKRLKATVVASSAQYDLAVLRLESVPEDAVELKPALAGCKPGEHVRLIGDVTRRSQIWGATECTVGKVGEQKLIFANDQKVTARLAQLEASPAIGKSTGGGPVVNDAGEVVAVIAGGAGDPPQLWCVDGSEVRYFLGIVYRKLASEAVKHHDYSKALALCDKSLAMNAKDPLAHNERGAALSFLDRYDDAIAAYTRAIELDPKLALAFRNRGSAHFYKGQYQQAVDDCTQAIKLDSRYALAYKTRSQAYVKLNRPAEARADEEQLRELNKINWTTTSPFPAHWFPD